MKVTDQALQLALACCAPALKPRERVVMKAHKPRTLALRPETQTNPEPLACALGKNDNAPIFLTQLAPDGESINALHQRHEPIGCCYGENPIILGHGNELRWILKEDTVTHGICSGLTTMLWCSGPMP